MIHTVNALLSLVLAINLFALGTSRILALIRIVAIQGVLLGLIPFFAGRTLPLPAVIAAGAAVLLKGVIIPAIMIRALRDAEIRREMRPMIGFLPSILLGAVATASALLFAGRLPLIEQHAGTLFVPASVATILTGFLLLITRFKALTQVVGYLVLENGIFIFGMLLIEAMPFVVEVGMLLDLFVGIFVICIITNHINQAFSSMDTRHLVTLKE